MRHASVHPSGMSCAPVLCGVLGGSRERAERWAVMVFDHVRTKDEDAREKQGMMGAASEREGRVASPGSTSGWRLKTQRQRPFESRGGSPWPADRHGPGWRSVLPALNHVFLVTHSLIHSCDLQCVPVSQALDRAVGRHQLGPSGLCVSGDVGQHQEEHGSWGHQLLGELAWNEA